MTSIPDESVQSLVELGFTGLEAEVYAALLRRSPATGYGIAQAIGKPAANVYKALESLEARGAVIVDEGSSRMCRAVPSDELLAQIERSFGARCARASRALRRLHGADGDDRVYQLRTAEQVYERARQMLARCEEVALVDAFPGPLEALRDELEAAAARGVAVAAKTYAAASFAKVESVLAPNGAAVIERWPGEWVNLVVDGQEHLIALLAPGGAEVLQAVWSGSPYLSWVYHSAVSSELILAEVEGRIEAGASSRLLRDGLARFERLRANHAPGYRTLERRFRDAEAADRSARKE